MSIEKYDFEFFSSINELLDHTTIPYDVSDEINASWNFDRYSETKKTLFTQKVPIAEAKERKCVYMPCSDEKNCIIVNAVVFTSDTKIAAVRITEKIFSSFLVTKESLFADAIANNRHYQR